MEIFETPFKLEYFRTHYTPTLGIKAKYMTREIEAETTKEEIFLLSKMYFDNLVSAYKNYLIDDTPITESSYRLYVEKVEDDELAYKHIYSIAHNNITDRISWENKFDDNIEIEGNFHIVIDISGYRVEDYDSEDEDEEPMKKAICETECIICFEKTPNILYLECLHKCVCVSCDGKGKFVRCPLCRTRIKNNKIK